MFPSTTFPGFYEIYGYSRYCISVEGRVINKETRYELTGSRNPAGYHNFRLKGDNGYTLTIGRHRLMAMVFKHPNEDISNLVVNHLNGIAGDDWLDNLEWTTYQGNTEHAGMMGLTTKCIPVAVRDIDTGFITNYPSATAAALSIGLTKDAVLYRIKIGMERVFPERKQYREGHTLEPWYIPMDIVTELSVNGRIKPLVARNVVSGDISYFDSMGDLAYFLKVSLPTVSTWMNVPDQPVLPGFYQLQFLNELTEWREVGDIYLELAAFTGMKPVKVTDTSTSISVVYLSSVDAAYANGLKPTALNYRLQNGNGKVFPDGKIYQYYTGN